MLLLKDIARRIKANWLRFAALAAIVALGCGFYAGLNNTGIDMRQAADAYYDKTKLFDLRVISDMGFEEADQERLSKIAGVDEAALSRSIDLLFETSSGSKVLRLQEISAAKDPKQVELGLASSKGNSLNVVRLVEGHWPNKAGEIVIFKHPELNLQLGQSIKLPSNFKVDTNLLDRNTFTICGFVESPVYPYLSNLGITTLGSGQIDTYAYTLASTFAKDAPYTEAYLSLANTDGLQSESDAYFDLVSIAKKKLNNQAKDLASHRRADIIAKAQAELDSKRADFESEKKEALDTLAAEKQKLDDAKTKLEQSKYQINQGVSAYNAGIDQLESKKAEAKAELEQGEKNLNSAISNFLSGLSDKGVQATSLEDAKSKVQAKLTELSTQKQEATSAESILEQQLEQLKAQTPPTDDQEFAAYNAQIAELEKQIEGLKQQLGQIAQAEAALQSAIGGADSLLTARSQLESKKTEVEASLSQAEQELAANKVKLDQGKADYEVGSAKYEQGLATYKTEEAKAHADLAKAEKKLQDAQADITSIAKPKLYILDRKQSEGSAAYHADADRLDAIAQVFPWMFFAVAVLVSLTSMTHMVEDDRLQIGSLKALGHTKARIAASYLIYALLASLLGATIGTLFLSQLLPFIITRAYASVYLIPALNLPLPIDPAFAAISIGLGSGLCLAATLIAALASLREKPAELLIPKSPKAGHRILLERISFIWSHLSFSWKITCRNIFLYKRRLLMTVIGISGCTALLLIGLGLRDAIWDSIQIQFEDLIHYDVDLNLSDAASEQPGQFLEKNFSVDHKNYLVYHKQTVFVANAKEAAKSGRDAKNTSSLVVVPNKADKLNDFVQLRERNSKEKLNFSDNAVIISEKLSQLFSVYPGDSIALFKQDSIGNIIGSPKYVKVTAVSEHYLGNNIFIGKAAWQNNELDSLITDEGASSEDKRFYNAAYLRYASSSSDLDHEILEKQLTQNPDVLSHVNTELLRSRYSDQIRQTNSTIAVLILSAALLAFIVLFNLSNINISERKRELATLKVLGFYPKEMRAYVFREIIILSAIGAAFGCVVGTFLARYVIQTAEADYLMYGRYIHLSSYAIAFALTMLFCFIILLSMRRLVRKVDMVSSLKSVE